MANNQDDLDDIPSLVPERDELVDHRKQKRGATGSSSRSSGSDDGPAGRTSGGVIFFLTLLFFGMCGTGAGGYYFYQQSELAKVELIAATNRITSLEGTLNQMDETTRQSAMGLLEKVDFNFSEIDKLWAARNTLRTEVEKLTATMTAVQKVAADLETAVTNHGGQLTQHNNQTTQMQTRIEEINKNFAGMTNLGQQLTQLNADLNRVKLSVEDANKRTTTAEEDIESINVYRLQLNQTIATLQSSISGLQQRLGQ
jgi:chromosome segregation ATPase